jgi:hypothetical protein
VNERPSPRRIVSFVIVSFGGRGGAARRRIP